MVKKGKYFSCEKKLVKKSPLKFHSLVNLKNAFIPQKDLVMIRTSLMQGQVGAGNQNVGCQTIQQEC